jgi:hypothetical protein
MDLFKHENLYITGAFALGLGLVFNKDFFINGHVPYLPKNRAGLFIIGLSATYLISRKAVKASAMKSLIATALIGSSFFFYDNYINKTHIIFPLN